MDGSIPGKTFIKVSKHNNSSGVLPSHIPNREKKDQGTLIIVGSILLGSSVFLHFLLVAAISLHRSYSSQKRQTHKSIKHFGNKPMLSLMKNSNKPRMGSEKNLEEVLLGLCIKESCHQVQELK